MTPAPRRFMTLPLALLLAAAGILAAAPAAADGTILYVNRVVVAPAGDVRLGDLLKLSGDASPTGREALAQSVAVLADRLVYLPLSPFMPALEAAFGRDAIIVGSHSIVIPKGTAAESEAYLIDRLVDWLLGQGMLGEGSVEIALTQNTVKGVPPRGGTPAFQVVRTVKGIAEVSFSLAGADGSAAGRAVFPTAAGVAESRPGLKPGTPVQIVFHKDLITIEMQGKALAAATIGDTVNVLVADSQKSFTGKVREGKVVEVDLP
jgi:hypothetical protein